MSKYSKKKIKKYDKGFACANEPLYTKEDFLYYFEQGTSEGLVFYSEKMGVGCLDDFTGY